MLKTADQARAVTGYRSAAIAHDHDFFRTPAPMTEALLEREAFTGGIWECACGDGAICDVFKARGIPVIATDLVERGYGQARVDFLMETRLAAPAIVTNPPFRLATEFLRHALRLAPDKACFLLPLRCLAGQERFCHVYRSCPPARVWVFAGRGERMHRPGYTGKVASSTTDFAWFVWERGDTGARVGWIP